MATDLARLVATLELNATKFQAGMAQSATQFAGFRAKVEEGVDAVKSTFEKLAGILIFGEIARGMRELSDESTTMQNKLRAVTEGSEDLANVQGKLFDAAQSSRTGLSDMTEVFVRLTRASNELGLSQDQLVALSTEISQAVQVEGGSLSEATNVVNQFSRALLTGSLGGRELRSFLIQAPGLAKAMAAGLGVSVGQMNKLAAAGSLTAEMAVNALMSQEQAIASEFSRVTPTIEAAWATLRNEALKFVGDMNAGGGAAGAIASAIMSLGRNLDNLARSFVVAAGAAGAFFAVKAVGNMAAAIAASFSTAQANRARAIASVAAAQAELRDSEAILLRITAQREEIVTSLKAAAADDVRRVTLNRLAETRLAEVATAKQVAAQTKTLTAAQATAAGAAGGAWTVLKNALNTVLTPFRALLGFLSANPWAAGIAAIIGVGVAYYEFGGKIVSAQDKLVNFKDVLSEGFGEATENIRTKASAIGEAFELAWGRAKKALLDYAAYQQRRDLFGVGKWLENVVDQAGIKKRMRSAAEGAYEDLAAATKGATDRFMTPSVTDPAAKKKIEDMIEGIRESSVAEREGSVAALEYRMRHGELAETMAKLGLQAGELHDALVAATRDEIAAGVEKTTQQLRTQSATFAQGDVAVMRYRISTGDLKTTFMSLGDGAAAAAKGLIEATRAAEGTKFKQMARDLQQQADTFQMTDLQVLEYRLSIGDLAAAFKELGAAGDVLRGKLISAQQAFDAKKLVNDIQEMQRAILDARGDTALASTLGFDSQTRDLRGRLEQSGNKAAQDQLATLRALTVAQAQFNQLQEEGQRIQDSLATTESLIQSAQETGAISEIQSLQQLSVARAESAAQLEDIRVKMDAIANSSKNPALIASAKRFGGEIDVLKQHTDALALAVQQDLTSNFTDAFEKLATGAASAGQTIVSVLKAIGAEIAHLLAQQAAAAAAGGIAKWLGMLFSAGAGSSLSEIDTGGLESLRMPTSDGGGSSLGHFASGGGFEVGGTGAVDSQLVQFMATPGERVNVSTPGQVGNSKGGGITLAPQYNIDARGATVDLARALPGIMKDNNKKMFDELDRRYGFVT